VKELPGDPTLEVLSVGMADQGDRDLIERRCALFHRLGQVCPQAVVHPVGLLDKSVDDDGVTFRLQVEPSVGKKSDPELGALSGGRCCKRDEGEDELIQHERIVDRLVSSRARATWSCARASMASPFGLLPGEPWMSESEHGMSKGVPTVRERGASEAVRA